MNDQREAIDYFKSQFVEKSDVQLKNALEEDLVPAAKLAIQELIEEKL